MLLALAIAASLCHGQSPPGPLPTAEHETLQAYANDRGLYGLPRGVARIEQLIARGHWTTGSIEFPASAAEDRYVRRADRLTLSRAADRYIEAHADVVGTVSIVYPYPRAPHFVVTFTRDVAGHLAELRSLTDAPLRARRALISRTGLRRTAARIRHDRPLLKRRGFTNVQADVDESDEVEVTVVGRRDDAAAFFTRRYGPGLSVRSFGPERFVEACVSADEYSIAGDDRTLTVAWYGSGSVRPRTLELTEYPDRVVVGPTERGPAGARTADLRRHELRVTLDAPLGGRAVVDNASGLRLRQDGPSPGEPPCPPQPPFPADGVRVMDPISTRQQWREPWRSQLAVVDRLRRDAYLEGGFFDGWGDEGFWFLRADLLDGVPTVAVLSPRTDGGPYFSARYGTDVRVIVAGTRSECIPLF